MTDQKIGTREGLAVREQLLVGEKKHTRRLRLLRHLVIAGKIGPDLTLK